MNNSIRTDILVPSIAILTSLLLFIFTDFFCEDGSCNVFLGDNYVEPLQIGVLGLIPTLLVFLWRRDIFVLWLKHIAWWYSFFTPWIIANFSDGLFFSEAWLAGACMTLLFIITLVYAFFMKGRIGNK